MPLPLQLPVTMDTWQAAAWDRKTPFPASLATRSTGSLEASPEAQPQEVHGGKQSVMVLAAAIPLPATLESSGNITQATMGWEGSSCLLKSQGLEEAMTHPMVSHRALAGQAWLSHCLDCHPTQGASAGT